MTGPQLLTGGSTVSGYALGILMLDTRFPRPRGDIGNAATWPFPVRYLTVRGARPGNVVGNTDPELLGPFVDGARRLVADGVRAITTSCGFLAAFQPELAEAVPVPVLTSSLLQVPVVSAMVGGRPVAVLTNRPGTLTDRHFAGAGWSADDLDVVVRAFPNEASFPTVYAPRDGEPEPDVADARMLRDELVDLAVSSLVERPDIAAFVSECTNFVPYSAAIRAATRKPVFDAYTLVTQAFGATTGTDFAWARPAGTGEAHPIWRSAS